MSRRKRISDVTDVLDSARQKAAQLKPVADRAKPLAKSTGAAARRQVRRARAWAAPQVERTGQVLQDTVAPKVSAALSAAAQRLEPAKTSRPRWRKPAGLATITAGATAVAAFIRRRMKPGRATADTAADQDGSAPGAQAGNGQAAPKKDADTKAADTDNAADVRTS